MASFSCWVQRDGFSQLQSGKISLSHVCLPCAGGTSAVNEVVEQTPLKADLLARLFFWWGLPQFFPASLHLNRVRLRKEWRRLLQQCQICSWLLLVTPHALGIGFIAMDLAEWSSESKDGVMWWLSAWGLPVGMSWNRREQEKCLCGGSLSLGMQKLLKTLFERDFAQAVRQRRQIWYPLLQGSAAMQRMG